LKQETGLSFSSLFARVVALVGGAALQVRRLAGPTPEPAWGGVPQYRRQNRRARSPH
jgi:hypothetical protein